MFRGRIAFNTGDIFYSTEKATENAVRMMLNKMGSITQYATSVTVQQNPDNTASTRGTGWYDLPERA